jgi:hypothetical protein
MQYGVASPQVGQYQPVAPAVTQAPSHSGYPLPAASYAPQVQQDQQAMYTQSPQTTSQATPVYQQPQYSPAQAVYTVPQSYQTASQAATPVIYQQPQYSATQPVYTVPQTPQQAAESQIYQQPLQYGSPQFFSPPQPYQTDAVYQQTPAYTPQQVVATPQAYPSVQDAYPVEKLITAPSPSRRSHRALPWREPVLTNLGEIILVSEFPNAMRQAKNALVPWLQQMNQERAAQGVHQIGIREHIIKHRQQTLCFASLDSEKFNRNLVVFVMPGTGIRHLENPTSGIDYKHLYRQANNGFNGIMVMVVGPISDSRLMRAGYSVGVPNPSHQGICDPILLDSGVFQGDPVTLRMAKSGMLFSFYQYLNEIQFNRLTDIIRKLSSLCHLSDATAKVKFHH